MPKNWACIIYSKVSFSSEKKNLVKTQSRHTLKRKAEKHLKGVLKANLEECNIDINS